MEKIFSSVVLRVERCPSERHVEALTLNTSESDLTGRFIADIIGEGKRRPYCTQIQYDWGPYKKRKMWA